MPAVLLQPDRHSPQQREALHQGATLTMLTILAVLVIGLAVLVLLSRFRRQHFERSAKKRPQTRSRADAWVEAANRMKSDDDTVDIDPDDLSPDDIRGGPTP